MDALSLTLTHDDITPSLEALMNDDLKRRMLLAAGTVIESFGTRAFDEPNLRPTSWPARKKSKATNPLLIGPAGNMRQSIHTQPQGSDTVLVGASVVYAAVHQLGSRSSKGRGGGIPPRPFFPVLDNQLTGNASAEIADVLSGIIERAAGG